MPDHGPVTADQVRDQVKECERIIKEWDDDDSPDLIVTYQGRDSKAISETIHEGFQTLQFLTAADLADIDARPLILAADEFGDVLEAYTRRATIHAGSNSLDPGGTHELWQGWQAMVAATKVRTARPPLESIAQLKSQKVTERQIAKMYDWYDDTGQPDVGKVFEEIATPGTHYNKETHETAHDRVDREKIENAWEARSNRRRQRGSNGRADRHGRGTGPTPGAPESVEELIRQGVSSKQIAMMKGVDQQTVRDLGSQMGLPVDNVAPGPAITPLAGIEARKRVDAERHGVQADRAAELAQERRDEAAETDEAEAQQRIVEINTYSELKNAREQVRQMTWDGVDPRDIHKALAKQWPGLKLQSVGQYARKAAADSEQTDEPTEAETSA